MSVRTGLALALLFLPACLLDRGGHTLGVLRPYDMKTVILDHVPLGTNVSRARRFMEKEGFQCEERKNADFTEGYINHSGVDFLLCKRTDQAGADGVDVNWEIAIALTDGSVGDVWLANDLLEMPSLPVTTPYSRIPPP
ncbi:MAG: hypothetical protein AB7K24_28965 [Gemmataceae bacterium]